MDEGIREVAVVDMMGKITVLRISGTLLDVEGGCTDRSDREDRDLPKYLPKS